MRSAAALAHPNIALIKYWGDLDPCLRIPANGSLSMNLAGLETRTRVTFDHALTSDILTVNGETIFGIGLERVRGVLDRVRQAAGMSQFAQVESTNNFPMGVGIASSASAFAALALASSSAAGLTLSEGELSRLARVGSGSACRSVPGGFVEWMAGGSDEGSYAFSIAPAGYWNLVDHIVLISQTHKAVGSTEGHARALTSPLQAARVADTPRRLEICRRAVCERDFPSLAEIVELDSNLMHAVMITSTPPLLYWQGATVSVIRAVQAWRQAGLPACTTIDAGPNVHVICQAEVADEVAKRLHTVEGVGGILTSRPGGPAKLTSEP